MFFSCGHEWSLLKEDHSGTGEHRERTEQRGMQLSRKLTTKSRLHVDMHSSSWLHSTHLSTAKLSRVLSFLSFGDNNEILSISEWLLSESKCLKKKNDTPILSTPSRTHWNHSVTYACIYCQQSIHSFPLVFSLSLPHYWKHYSPSGYYRTGLGIEICSLLVGCGIYCFCWHAM